MCVSGENKPQWRQGVDAAAAKKNKIGTPVHSAQGSAAGIICRGDWSGGMRAGRDHVPQVGGLTAVLTTVLTRRHETCVKTMVFLSVP